jgi:hypothetical protein
MTARVLTWLLLSVLVGAGLFITGCGAPVADTLPLPHWADAPDGPSLQITVDLTNPESRRMGVTMDLAGLPDGDISFKGLGEKEEYIYSNVVFSDGAGGVIDTNAEKNGWNLPSGAKNGRLRVSYDLTPGGLGRHGHQGMVDAGFAVVDGRAWMVPSVPLDAARIKVEGPDDWSVASRYEENDGWFNVQPLPFGRISDELQNACIAFGLFNEQRKVVGSTEVRVFSASSWSESHQKKLNQKSFALYQWFYDEFGYDVGGPVAVVWTPKIDNERLFGGAYSSTNCMEHPKDRLRNWQLLAHRLGHGLNRYVPTGLLLRDERDRWLEEGFASYIEVVATAGSGAAKDEGYWNTLLTRHFKRIKQHPEWHNRPLADETSTKDDETEYVHYTRAPIVAKMLAYWLEKKSGKTLEAFMKQTWAKHGRYRGSIALRDDLEDYAGVSLSDFWSVMVDQDGPPVPVWEEYMKSSYRKAASVRAAATVAGTGVSGDYLWFLARSGDFNCFAAIRDFIADAAEKRAALASAGVAPYPAEIREHIAGLSPEVRYDIERFDLMWPLPEAPEVEAAPANLVFDRDHVDGRDFADLLKLEEVFQSNRGKSGVLDLYMRIDEAKEGKTLAVLPGDDIVLHTKWVTSPRSATVSLRIGDELHGSKDVFVQPGWTHTWSKFFGTNRTGETALLVGRVQNGDFVIERPFWQRADSKSLESLKPKK